MIQIRRLDMLMYITNITNILFRPGNCSMRRLVRCLRIRNQAKWQDKGGGLQVI